MQDAAVHPCAIVDEGAVIGPGTRIWHWTHISTAAVVGSNCTLGQGVFVGRGVRIGNGVKIQNNVSVYEGVTLEDEVFCGPSMVFTNVVNPRAAIERKTEFRPTLVRRGASLGANCTILCGVTLGEYCLVGAGAVVTQDVPAYALVTGVPARRSGWFSRHGHRLDLPLAGQGTAACPQTGESYRLAGETLTRMQD
jgi:UDP-2-acetamido-3-amino-2,3-dideoxy-glucuronate N-acetyltransferase